MTEKLVVCGSSYYDENGKRWDYPAGKIMELIKQEIERKCQKN